jgi:hypothetical protein
LTVRRIALDQAFSSERSSTSLRIWVESGQRDRHHHRQRDERDLIAAVDVEQDAR